MVGLAVWVIVLHGLISECLKDPSEPMSGGAVLYGESLIIYQEFNILSAGEKADERGGPGLRGAGEMFRAGGARDGQLLPGGPV